jgi:hypothetical protein
MDRLRVMMGQIVLLVGLWNLAGLAAAHAEEMDKKAVPTGEDSWVELEVRGWAPSLRGTVQSSSASMIGTNLSLGDTLGMDTSRQFVWPKATLHFAKNHRIWASYLDMQYSGDKTLTQDVTFGGSTFTATQSVHSELNFKEIAGGYQYDWLKFSKFASNLNLQVHYLDINAKLRSNAVGAVTESIKAPIPTIGVGMQVWPVDWLKLHGDFNIFKLGVAGFKGEMIDSQAALTVSPWEWLGASVGYRYYRLIARDTDSGDRADWLQHGPYVSVMVRF